MTSIVVKIEEASIVLPNKQTVTADIEFSVWVPHRGDWYVESDLEIACYGVGEDGECVHLSMHHDAPGARRWVRDNEDRIYNAVERAR
jgi:hypothetical protein